MTGEEIRVLKALDESGAEWVYNSKIKAEELGMTTRHFLGICRGLRDLGLVKLQWLSNDEGQPCGSAYMRTKKGEDLIATEGAQ